MSIGRKANLRLATAERSQVKFEQSSLDDLLSEEHVARQVWAYVEGLDLSALYDRVRTTATSSGRAAIDPAVLMSLWMYATVEGIGSARLLDRKCCSDAAYRWLAGGVSVNYHTLSDFRTAAGPLLDRLLSGSVASLIEAGIIDMSVLAVDGVRVQAWAGRKSLRRGERLEELHRAAVEAVSRLRAELREDPGSASKRQKARRLVAAEDRVRQVEEARRAHAEIEGKRVREGKQQRRKNGKAGQKEARASTSDPQARVMKMGDGSYRPAYNIQFKTTVDRQHVVGVSVTNQGSDRGLLGPAVAEIEDRYGVTPNTMLADTGFDSHADIDKLHKARIMLFCPLRKPRKNGLDPAVPRRGDKPGVVAWRQRMATPEAQAIYRKRFATERPHAHMRNHGLRQLCVRGIEKVKAIALWHVHAFNFLQVRRLNGLPA
jgi:transposase